MLWLALRRITDVLMTLIPLLVAGIVTLEICVVIGLPLNFANIVALPLLLGVGVAFKIYYVTAWRSGRTNLLQTSLTRAIFFSAMTTATAFGSLWLSSHPGTASMGKLLALSLVTTLAAVLLFQPALMGKPRDVGEETDIADDVDLTARRPASVPQSWERHSTEPVVFGPSPLSLPGQPRRSCLRRTLGHAVGRA